MNLTQALKYCVELTNQYFMKLPSKIVLLLFFGLISNIAIAGWVISEVSYDRFGNKQFQTTFIQNNMIRFETESSVAIINLKTGNITLVFGMYKLYWQGSIKEFKQGTLEVFEKKLESIVATATPEQKEVAIELIALMRKGMELSLSDTTTLSINMIILKTDIVEVIAGFKAIKYDVTVDDSIVESIWITDSINPYMDVDIESMISFTNELKPNRSDNSIDGSTEYLNLIRKGLAVKSQEINPNGGMFTTVVTGVIETNINNEIFQYPSNYRKAQLAEIMLIRDSEIDNYRLEQEFHRAKENPLYD